MNNVNIVEDFAHPITDKQITDRRCPDYLTTLADAFDSLLLPPFHRRRSGCIRDATSANPDHLLHLNLGVECKDNATEDVIRMLT